MAFDTFIGYKFHVVVLEAVNYKGPSFDRLDQLSCRTRAPARKGFEVVRKRRTPNVIRGGN
ncbi:hypothetical protein BC936DRAFT_144801 [Jimgerdemannia flammicorona]|uniref:Uncharacterized protein n=1 Tax=Jimgerdemannia flammicorona TaxID=994334 RepID=A0A433DM47_9FUNG|nr:hypothetical protein BC936DRAFT_144801 [Jimgerdemannia flammicorona]